MMLLMLRMMLLMVDHSRSRMVDRKMIRRRQALRRVGVMHVGRDAPELG